MLFCDVLSGRVQLSNVLYPYLLLGLGNSTHMYIYDHQFMESHLVIKRHDSYSIVCLYTH